MNDLPGDILWLFLKHVLILHGPVKANKFSRTFKRIYGIYQSKETERLEIVLTEPHLMRPVVCEFLAMEYCKYNMGTTEIDLCIDDEEYKKILKYCKYNMGKTEIELCVDGCWVLKTIAILARNLLGSYLEEKFIEEAKKFFIMNVEYQRSSDHTIRDNIPYTCISHHFLRSHGIRIETDLCGIPCEPSRLLIVEPKDLHKWFELSWQYGSDFRGRYPARGFGLIGSELPGEPNECWKSIPFIRLFEVNKCVRNQLAFVGYDNVHHHLLDMPSDQKTNTIDQLKEHRGHISDLF